MNQVTPSKNPNLRSMYDVYGAHLEAYVQDKLSKLVDRNLKGGNEFETLWATAEVEGRKRALRELVAELKNL